jgi:predicted ArsR family transcriptional regulator
MRSSGDIAVVLRKLIDSGKVSVGDIASEVGISSESLEAALVVLRADTLYICYVSLFTSYFAKFLIGRVKLPHFPMV